MSVAGHQSLTDEDIPIVANCEGTGEGGSGPSVEDVD